MANANTEVTLPQLQEAVEAAVRAAFPQFKTVEFDRDDEDENIPLPACLLSFVEAEPAPDADAGTGQWPALARFEAHVLFNARRSERVEVKIAAVALAAWLNLRRFPGVNVDPCQVIACEPDEFAPNVESRRAWRVEWVMPAMFGNSAWACEGDGAAPRSFFSFAPWIGIPHEDRYVEAGEPWEPSP